MAKRIFFWLLVACQVVGGLGLMVKISEASNQNMFSEKLVNWVKSNMSTDTNLPLSFYIPEDQKAEVYGEMGKSDSVEGIIERVIVEEGLVVYDGAVGQIVLTMLGGDQNLELAAVPLDVYWKGRLGNSMNIRTGHDASEGNPKKGFIYDPQNPSSVSSELSDKGRRGFIFRIINANGRYNTADPLDGKTSFKGFPTWPTIHWEDWKPVAGENAWVAIAALHLFHKKYYDEHTNTYQKQSDSVELLLAEELARAALILQTQNGGIRMAPLGTYRKPEKGSNVASYDGQWWYHQISTENNISWYAALRMLHTITQKSVYRTAVEQIESYFRGVWNEEGKYFYQGMHYVDGRWKPNNEHFATDVQTWGILAVGSEKIDSWFGEGSSYQMWEITKSLSGVTDEENRILGVGYSRENNRISVEWTAGAIFAANDVALHYKETHPQWAKQSFRDATTMREGLEEFRTELAEDKAAYSYSSRRGWIPFGWFSHNPSVLSLASTGWVMLVDAQFNPFYL